MRAVLLKVTLIVLFMLLNLAGLGVAHSPDVLLAAPSGPFTWSPPENVTRTPQMSGRPALVSDRYGYVHLFWGEDYDGPVTREGAQRRSNTIYYRRWDGTQWSDAVDLFDGSSNDSPVVAVDETSRLYLLYTAGDGLHFSSAPSQLAGSAAAWTKARLLEPGNILARPTIIARGKGELRIAYTLMLRDGVKDGNVYYRDSRDGGESWSEPVQITNLDATSYTVAPFPILAQDNRGRLHLAWHYADPPDFTGTAVYYSRSMDDGKTWTTPLKMAEVGEKVRNSQLPQLVALGNEVIHYMWVCGEVAGRCEQVSVDGGATWGPTRRLFGDMNASADYDAVVADPATGTAYWVMKLRFPEALYYSYLIGDEWASPPIMIDDSMLHGGHAATATIANGNELHVAVEIRGRADAYDIGYARGVNPQAPRTEPQPTPPPTPTPTPAPTATAETAARPTPTPYRPARIAQTGAAPLESNERDWAMSTTVLPVLLFLGGVVALILFRRR
ncbi:MAG: exo-alpha-sialidase [Anaerolineae bacterium]|nr:exo-alpha-sialidase [Anaerolineae bacterium]